MRTLLFIIVSFLSTISAFAEDYSIIFVHIGKMFPAYLKTAVAQAQLFNEKGAIYVVANEEAIAQAQEGDFSNAVRFVTCESLKKTDEHIRFIKNSKLDKVFRDGFWNHATERFFYLDDLVRQYDLENVFHLESDVMLYADLTKLLPVFKKQYKGMIAATFDNDQRCIPGFIYFPDAEALARLTLFMSYQVSELGRRGNDMVFIGHYRSHYNKTYIDTLPIVMSAYADFNPLVNSAKKGTWDPKAYFNHFNQFNSIFDAAAIGQYLGGTDARNNVGAEKPVNSGPGFINEACLFNPSFFTYVWEVDSLGRKVPYAVFKGKKYPINNLHIHSKNLEAFKS